MTNTARRAATLAAVAALLPAATLSAQTWQNIPAGAGLSNTNHAVAPGTRAFWNNGSNDGQNCNIGFVLAGATNCANQRPSNWLPYNGTQMTTVLASGSNGESAARFMFGAGTYVFRGGLGLSGDIAGQNQNWGTFLASTPGTLSTVTLGGGAQVLTFGEAWGFWIDLATPAGITRSSQTPARHFALFANGSNATLSNMAGIDKLVTTTYGDEFVVGMEDIGCGQDMREDVCPQNADFDNNDVVLSFAPVPEPSTYALLGSGMALLAGFARRRARTVA